MNNKKLNISYVSMFLNKMLTLATLCDHSAYNLIPHFLKKIKICPKPTICEINLSHLFRDLRDINYNCS